MDPERLAIMEALRRLGAVPHQRDLNIAPRSESYMDALSEADPRDMSPNEQFVQRNAPVIPEYMGHDESDPNEMEPDNDADDYYGGPSPAQMSGAAISPSEFARLQGMHSQHRAPNTSGGYSPSAGMAPSMGGAAMSNAEYERMRSAGPNPAMLALSRLRGGR